MASSDIVTPARRLILIGDVEENRPNSEAVNEKIAGTVNYLLSSSLLKERFVFDGYFENNTFDEGVGGIVRLEGDSIIASYTMAVHKSGTANQSQMNIKIYDAAGAYVNDLFGSGVNQPSISGGSGTNVMVGKEKIDTTTPQDILLNTAGHIVQTGNLNIGTEASPLLAGYVLVPYIVDSGLGARNISIDLRIKEL
jgi:hypothetical protein